MGSTKNILIQKVKTEQKLVLTFALRQALSILEMPLPELAEWLREQIEQNPALQFAEEEAEEELEDATAEGFEVLEHLDPLFSSAIFPETHSEQPPWIEQIASPPPTLSHHLLQQAREALSSSHDLTRMEELIGNLDEKGFLAASPTDPSLLNLLQSLDPPGVGARSLQEALLLQLKRQGKKDSIAYRIVHDHYDDFIHSRHKILCQKISCTTEKLQTIIQETLSSLSLDPAAPFRHASFPTAIPEIFIEGSAGQWRITLSDAFLPKFKRNFSDSSDMRHFETAALWVEKMIGRRHQILTQVVKLVAEIQSDYFQGNTSDLQPLTLHQAAKKLKLHESTLSRIVKDKYLFCPRGIFPLRFFFPHATANSNISHHTAKERLKELINHENKQNPLSDQKLAAALHAQGVLCSRRTVTKYRRNLKLPPAFQRAKKIGSKSPKINET